MTSKLKRYVIYHGSVYYPGEGMSDFVHTCDSESEAIVVAHKLCQKECLTWSQVFDTHDFNIVKQFHHDGDDGVTERNFGYVNKQINVYLSVDKTDCVM